MRTKIEIDDGLMRQAMMFRPPATEK